MNHYHDKQSNNLPIDHSGITETSGSIRKSTSFDYSSSSSTYSSNYGYDYDKIAMGRIAYERDRAIDEAQEAKEALSAVMEAIQILTRHLKRSYSSDIVQTKVEDDSFSVSSDLSIGDHDDASDQDIGLNFDILLHKDVDVDNGIRNDPAITSIPTHEKSNTNRKRTLSGVSASSIATYITHDNHRYSELLQQCFNRLQPELCTVGAELIALHGASRAIEQNAKLISEESSIMLQDLHQAHLELSELDDRCCKAEQCAKQLYKENKILKREVEKNKTERKVLVREIKILLDEKKSRENFQQELLDNLKAHENIMIERSMAAKGSARQGPQTSIDKDLKAGISNKEMKKEEGQNGKKDSSEPRSKSFNPFGKILFSFSGSTTMQTEESVSDDIISDTIPRGLSSASSIEVSNNTSMSSVSSTLATMLETPNFDDDTNDADSVLQLTPTASTCENMKSALSAKDLNPEEGHKKILKPCSKDVVLWKQRKVNSPPTAVPKTAVVVVKRSPRNSNVSISGSNKITNVPRKITTNTKKQYRHYTIS